MMMIQQIERHPLMHMWPALSLILNSEIITTVELQWLEHL